MKAKDTDFNAFRKQLHCYESVYYTFAKHPDFPDLEVWVPGTSIVNAVRGARNKSRCFGQGLKPLDGSYVYHVATGRIVAKLTVEGESIKIDLVPGKADRMCCETFTRALYLLGCQSETERKNFDAAAIYLSRIRHQTNCIKTELK